MLVDLYGLVETDATFGVPVANLRHGGREDNQPTAEKIASIGVHAVWAVKAGTWRSAGGDWAVLHRVDTNKAKQADWTRFWDRVDLLKQIGALFYEPWLFDSDALDAEPLMPLDPAAFYAVAEPEEEAKLTRLAFDAARMLIGEERSYVMDNVEADYFVPLPLHQQPPALRSIAKLRVEADTPGRRLAWKRRRTLIERLEQSYRQVLADAESAAFNNPMRSSGMGATL
jgi:hypothetical protein